MDRAPMMPSWFVMTLDRWMASCSDKSSLPTQSLPSIRAMSTMSRLLFFGVLASVNRRSMDSMRAAVDLEAWRNRLSHQALEWARSSLVVSPAHRPSACSGWTSRLMDSNKSSRPLNTGFMVQMFALVKTLASSNHKERSAASSR